MCPAPQAVGNGENQQRQHIPEDYDQYLLRDGVDGHLSYLEILQAIAESILVGHPVVAPLAYDDTIFQ